MAFGGSRRKYPALDCAEVKRILKALGFEQRRNNAGSHETWINDHETKGRLKVTVDCPKAPFSVMLIKSMIKQAGSDRDAFYQATRKTARKIQIKKNSAVESKKSTNKKTSNIPSLRRKN